MREPDPRKLPDLDANWVFDERDLLLAAKLVPGASLNVLRWPVSFGLVYIGISLFGKQTGPLFGVLSASLIVAFWVAMMLGMRRIQIRGLARMPEAQRRIRLSLARGTLRYEDASGRAQEWPLADVAGAVVRPEGVLFRIRTLVVFVPERALSDSGDVWREAFSRLPQWTKSIGQSFTYVLWAFSALVALYGFVR